MRTIDAFSSGFRQIRARTARSLLTVLGIVIGVAAVVALITTVKAASRSVYGSIKGLGSNLLVVSIGPSRPKVSWPYPTTLTLTQAASLARVPGVSAAAPVAVAAGPVLAGPKTAAATVYGSTGKFFAVRGYRLAWGRFLGRLDVAQHLDVVDLGAGAAIDLFGRVNPVGHSVMIEGQPFTVIGVLAAKGSTLGLNQDEVAIIPITTLGDMTGMTAVNVVYVSAKTPEVVPAVQSGLAVRLLDLLQSPQDFFIITQEQILSAVQKVTNVLTYLLGGVAGISLLVGGIGVMNIMLVSVTERTREIGIRKALGAWQRDILAQFLLEAVALTTVGGVIGIVIGMLLAAALAGLMKVPYTISADAIVLAFGFSWLVGVVFGVYPAVRAARLAPADALRLE